MVEELLPRLFRIVVPLHGNPLKEINAYVLVPGAGERSLVIDTGMNRPECREALDAGFAAIGLDLERTDFVATHLHADHQGLIPALLREGATAYMGAADAERMLSLSDPFAREGSMAEYARRSGLPEGEIDAMLANHPGFKYGSGAAISYAPLRHGEILRVGDWELEVIETPGHTPGHVCLYERARRVFFSGDHVLGDITPHIQSWSDTDDSLSQYVGSLREVGALDVAVCLPGHRRPIADLGKRIDELVEHHRVRANEVLEILDGQSLYAYDTAARMRWDIRARSWQEFPLMQRWFATGEAIAHLRYLEERGLVARESDDGAIRYARVGHATL